MSLLIEGIMLEYHGAFTAAKFASGDTLADFSLLQWCHWNYDVQSITFTRTPYTIIDGLTIGEPIARSDYDSVSVTYNAAYQTSSGYTLIDNPYVAAQAKKDGNLVFYNATPGSSSGAFTYVYYSLPATLTCPALADFGSTVSSSYKGPHGSPGPFISNHPITYSDFLGRPLFPPQIRYSHNESELLISNLKRRSVVGANACVYDPLVYSSHTYDGYINPGQYTESVTDTVITRNYTAQSYVYEVPFATYAYDVYYQDALTTTLTRFGFGQAAWAQSDPVAMQQYRDTAI